MIRHGIFARRATVGLLLAGASILAAPAKAQETSAPADDEASSTMGAGTNEDIIVTARKRAENVQDVPIAITPVTARALEARGFSSLIDLNGLAPGLQLLASSGMTGTLKPAMRGQYQQDLNPNVDNSVAVYVDGVLLPRAAGLNMNFPDIERIDVLRGPQGTLFGRNTPGGAISVTTSNPQHNELSGSVKVGIGNYERRTAQAVINLPLVEDKLSLRAGGFYQKHDGYDRIVVDPTTPVSGRSFNDDNSFGVQAKLRFTPSSVFDVVIKGDYTKIDATSWLGRIRGFLPTLPNATRLLLSPVIGGPRGNPNPFYSSYLPTQEFENYGVSGTFVYDLSDSAQIKFIGAYRRLNQNTQLDVDGSIVQINNSVNVSTNNMYTGELQLTGKAFDNAVDYAVGIYLFREKGVQDALSASRTVTWLPFAREPGTFVSGSTQNGGYENSSTAAFAQATWHATDRFDLTGGLRYTKDWKDLTTRNYAVVTVGGVNGFNCRSTTSSTVFFSTTIAGCSQDLPTLKNDSLDYTLTAQYKFDQHVMTYFKVASGYRAGGQQIAGSDPFTFQPFGPEKVVEFEVGFKGDFFDRRLRVNLAAFMDSYKDIQRTNAILDPLTSLTRTLTTNAAKGKTRGFELEITATPTKELTLGGSLAYIDAYYVNFTSRGLTDPTVIIDRSSENFPGTPEWMASVYADYSLPVPVGALNFHADYAWHDSYLGATASAFGNQYSSADLFAPSGGEVNARVSLVLAAQDLEVSLWGRNLANSRHVVSVTGGIGARLGYWNSPRTYGLEAKLRF